MATPATAASDAASPQPEESPLAEAPTPVAEPEEASGPGAAAAVEEAAAGDASSAPAPTPTPTSTSSAAVPPPPDSPAAPGPPRPPFAASPAYVTPPASAPSPAFSYNVLPRAPPPRPVGSGAAHQQLPSAPVQYRHPILCFSLYALPSDCMRSSLVLYRYTTELRESQIHNLNLVLLPGGSYIPPS
jgi:transcription elongation regulator 1